jgi:Immunity protein 17
MLEAMSPLGLLIIGVGVFALAGSICDWDWFMNARKARFMVAILTRNGARIFYALLGLALGTLGIIDLAKDVTG